LKSDHFSCDILPLIQAVNSYRVDVVHHSNYIHPAPENFSGYAAA